MKNNKITRKRAERLSRNQQFVKQADGTEVLHSKEARAKNRRWSFEADVVINLPAKQDEAGNDIPAQSLPMRTLRLGGISFGNTLAARNTCSEHEDQLRSQNEMFSRASIKVRAIPHETVSNETLNQLKGYRDMSMILDMALEIAVTDAAAIVSGFSVGSQFVQMPAVPSDGEGKPDIPARTVITIKEEFYSRALKVLEVRADGPERDVPSDTEVEEQEKEPFVPEIVEVQRTSSSEEQSTEAVPA